MSLRHVAIYVPTFDQRPAGLGVYIDQIGKRLVASMPRVTVFTQTPEHVPWQGVAVERIPRVEARGALDLVRRQAFLHTQLPVRLAQLDADALFVPFHDGCLLPSRPQVMVVHDLTPLVYPSPFFNPLLRRYLTDVLPRVMARTARIVTVSRHTQLDVVRLLGIAEAKTEVVGEGYDRTTYRPRSDAEVAAVRERLGVERPYVLYAGTYARHKNVTMLADAFVALRRVCPDTELVLCGRPDAGDFDAVRERLAAGGAWSATRVLGYVEGPDLSALMTGAIAFAYPSLYEGFGLAPLEAMGSGAVVVASTSASVPEVVGDGGVLLPPHEPALWASTLARLAADDTERRRLRDAALARAARFRWDDAAERIRGLLEEVTAKPAVAAGAEA